jgi:hypothetical protein
MAAPRHRRPQLLRRYSIGNDGLVDVDVTGYGNAIGINASNFYGDVSVVNGSDGDVFASTDNAYGGTATGIKARSVIGGSSVVNYGDIDASAIAVYGNATAYGVLTRGGYYGITSVANEGNITSYASTGDGVGWAWGVRERGRYAELDNSGLISAEAHAGTATPRRPPVTCAAAPRARAIPATSSPSPRSSTADSPWLTARMTWGYYTSSVDNQGNIEAHASTASGTASASGTSSHYDHESSVVNSGSILADSYSAIGFAASMGVYNYALDLSTVSNSEIGTITALATGRQRLRLRLRRLARRGYLSTLDQRRHSSAPARASTTAAPSRIAGGMARSIGASVLARYGAPTSTTAAAVHRRQLGSAGRVRPRLCLRCRGAGRRHGHMSNSGSISAQAYPSPATPSRWATSPTAPSRSTSTTAALRAARSWPAAVTRSRSASTPSAKCPPW